MKKKVENRIGGKKATHMCDAPLVTEALSQKCGWIDDSKGPLSIRTLLWEIYILRCRPFICIFENESTYVVKVTFEPIITLPKRENETI